jgi:predicted ArsR family transcriptional regulator
MEGLTVAEIAEKLKISEGAVRMRLSRAGIKPLTNSPIYPYSVVEKIKEAPMGRPKKTAAPKSKTAKKTKK